MRGESEVTVTRTRYRYYAINRRGGRDWLQEREAHRSVGRHDSFVIT